MSQGTLLPPASVARQRKRDVSLATTMKAENTDPNLSGSLESLETFYREHRLVFAVEDGRGDVGGAPQGGSGRYKCL